MRSNCLFWALGQWRRHGGYIALRRTRMKPQGPWCHVLWSPDLATWRSFVPEPERRAVFGLLPKIWFKGVVREGD